MSHAIDERGNRYGRLKVIRPGGKPPGRKEAVWICRCDCGLLASAVRGTNLRNGRVVECAACHNLTRQKDAST